MRGLRVLSLLVISIMLLMSISPITQVTQIARASSQKMKQTSTNSVNVMDYYGLLKALNTSIKKVEALFREWGVPHNSTLWKKLEEINNTITYISELLKQGRTNEAARLASQVFNELGVLVSEAAKLYRSPHHGKVLVNETVEHLVSRVNRLIAEERALLASLAAAQKQLENMLRHNFYVKLCNGSELNKLLASLHGNISLEESLLDKTLSLRKALLSGDIDPGKASKELAALEAQFQSLTNETSLLMNKVRSALSEMHSCKVLQAIKGMVNSLEEKIAELTKEAKKLRKEGKKEAAKMIEEEINMLKKIISQYSNLAKATQNTTKPQKIPSLPVSSDIIKVIIIRHMMPSFLKHIVKQITAKPIPIVLPGGIDEEILRLEKIRLELRAAKLLVPDQLADEYNAVLGNLTELIRTLKAYRASKGSVEEVVKAAKDTLTALEEFKKQLIHLQQEVQPQNSTSTGATTTTSSTKTSTITTIIIIHGNTTTPTRTITVAKKNTPIHGQGEKVKQASKGGKAKTSTSIRLSALLKLVNNAEAEVKKLLLLLGSPQKSLGSVGTERVVSSAIRLSGAAEKLAEIAGNKTLVTKIDELRNFLVKARESLTSGNISAAKLYLAKAFAEASKLTSSIQANDWVSLRIKAFLDHVKLIIEALLLMLSASTS